MFAEVVLELIVVRSWGCSWCWDPPHDAWVLQLQVCSDMLRYLVLWIAPKVLCLLAKEGEKNLATKLNLVPSPHIIKIKV